MPNIPDVAAFLSTPMVDVDTDDLTAIDIPAATAAEIVTALNELRTQIAAPNARLSDLFFLPAT
jgi:hypothetical protein